MKFATRNNHCSSIATVLGEPEQVRASPALELNFLQHIFTILEQHGRAAVVLSDNDSHLPSCSPFGLLVHVVRSRDLHCPLRRRRRRMPARSAINMRAANLHGPGRQTIRACVAQASRRPHASAPAHRHLDSSLPSSSASRPKSHSSLPANSGLAQRRSPRRQREPARPRSHRRIN